MVSIISDNNNSVSLRITIIAVLLAFVFGVLTLTPESSSFDLFRVIARALYGVTLLLLIIYVLWEAQRLYFNNMQTSSRNSLPDFCRYFFDFGIDLTVFVVFFVVTLFIGVTYFPNDFLPLVFVWFLGTILSSRLLFGRFHATWACFWPEFSKWFFKIISFKKIFSTLSFTVNLRTLVVMLFLFIIPLIIGVFWLLPFEDKIPLKVSDNIAINDSVSVIQYVPDLPPSLRTSISQAFGFSLDPKWTSICFSGNGSYVSRFNGTDMVNDSSSAVQINVSIDNETLAIPLSGVNCTSVVKEKNFIVKRSFYFLFDLSNQDILNVQNTRQPLLVFHPRMYSYAVPDFFENLGKTLYFVLAWAVFWVAISSVYFYCKPD
ncbi:MAG: hypothetical protein WC408_00185 [Candidatus Micrarchaeia archaeon]